jgi:SAM-dependent methyltransferase
VTLKEPPAALARNGYALTSDLEDEHYRNVVGALESLQIEFLAQTHGLWDDAFPVPPDALAHFSRQWEYPYAWANAGEPGRLLDAGSGITFLPFAFARVGFEVVCCDSDEDDLDFETRFARAAALTGSRVEFVRHNLEELPFEDGSFDTAVCISVVEHVHSRQALLDSLARVVRPGGTLVITCDLDLEGKGDLGLPDLAELLASFERAFEHVHPLDLARPPTLLTSEAFASSAQWRLPAVWRTRNGPNLEPLRSLAVLGLVGRRRS